ncbi:MAG: hypothetical protein J5844_02975 [Clostridia bacterium]|nr:hypothetical protein [Clostridia bacterium]
MENSDAKPQKTVEKEPIKKNPFVKVLKTCAWIIFIGGFVYGILQGIASGVDGKVLWSNGGYYPSNWTRRIYIDGLFSDFIAYVAIPTIFGWIKAFLTGMVFMFLAELLKVLEGIKNK